MGDWAVTQKLINADAPLKTFLPELQTKGLEVQLRKLTVWLQSGQWEKKSDEWERSRDRTSTTKGHQKSKRPVGYTIN